MSEPAAASAQLLAALRELALDLRWTWSHEADALWAHINPELWEQSHNPWSLLQDLPLARLRELAADHAFVADLQSLIAMRQAYHARDAWFQSVPGASALSGVAYFSLEFGLGDALPLFAGGLGVLAGDTLKAASDLGAPLVGVGLLYQEGYFRQVLDAAGAQRELYPPNNPSDLPIQPAMADGAWLRVPIRLPGRELHLRVWRASVGRRALYLLDSNDPLNSPSDRGVTAKLYGGDPEARLLQELALGVGGWRVLETLGLAVDICHINEGHAAFAIVERASRAAGRAQLSFDEGLWATRAGNVFTTHTPVAAGFDRFAPDLLDKYLACFSGAPGGAGPSRDQLYALGRMDPDDAAEPFNMAYLGMRGSGACFAVSRRHAEVSRSIFQPLFPRRPAHEVPVAHVTNGVHTPSWDSAEADALWTCACGKERWRLQADEAPAQIANASDEAIWTMRGESRAALVAHVRRRLAIQLATRGLDGEGAAIAQRVFDPNVLTLGFARRFTAYKRPNLLLADPDRLARILLDDARPVQLVVAGKAHPDDFEGKAMIRQWVALAETPRLRSRLVFLEDYDLGLAQELVQGVDVWLNTPRPPWEACGTSGMKVLVNGGLNCSVLDGWWAEAFEPGVGWAIDASAGDDAADAEALYRLIEQAIAPEFYARDASGAPRAWVARIRRSMSTLTARFGSARMLADYLQRAYLPAAQELQARAAQGWAGARDMAGWAERLRRHWDSVHLGEPAVTRTAGAWRISVPVFLGEISPEDVALELYAEPLASGPEVAPMEQGPRIAGALNGYVYAGEVPASRPAGDYTVRLVPRHPGVRAPTELPLIAWQR